jgi:tetratricopeptide (TPR) repeat protein
MVKLKGKYEPSDYQRGLAALEREEFVKAQYHLISASRHWTAADPKRSDLLSAMIGVLQDSIDSKAEAASDAAKLSRSKSETQSGAQVQKEELQKLLLLALKWFPSSSESFARIDKLLNLVEESKDKTKISEALQLSMEVSKTWLRNMARHKENGVSRGDVYQLQAELKSKMGNLEGAKKLYKNAAEAYQASIKSSKQDEYRERGYNLERIYCLWKAGDFDRAGALYTQLQDNYPDDFTFFYQHAHMFKEQKKWDLVLEKSAVAQRLSYGDNKLRVSHLMAEALKNLDRKKESIKLIDSVLNEFHVPGTVSVRTTRYVAKLKNLRQEIETGN